jgi:hypothetical protein
MQGLAHVPGGRERTRSGIPARRRRDLGSRRVHAKVKESRAAEILAEHAGISSKWAGHYSDHLSSTESSAREMARDVISQLGQKKRKQG